MPLLNHNVNAQPRHIRFHNLQKNMLVGARSTLMGYPRWCCACWSGGTWNARTPAGTGIVYWSNRNIKMTFRIFLKIADLPSPFGRRHHKIKKNEFWEWHIFFCIIINLVKGFCKAISFYKVMQRVVQSDRGIHIFSSSKIEGIIYSCIPATFVNQNHKLISFLISPSLDWWIIEIYAIFYWKNGPAENLLTL